jgi:hypothetical protein
VHAGDLKLIFEHGGVYTQYSPAQFAEAFPDQVGEMARRFPSFMGYNVPSNLRAVEQAGADAPAVAALVAAAGIPNLAKVSDLPRLEFDQNVPGLGPREDIALRSGDVYLRDHLQAIDQARRGAFGGNFPDHNPDRLKEEVKFVMRQVAARYTKVFDDNDRAAWQRLQAKYKDAKLVIGAFIKRRSGCCRHFAVSMQGALQHNGFATSADIANVDAKQMQERGYLVRYCRGDFTSLAGVALIGGRHAWNEVTIDGVEYIADAIQPYSHPSLIVKALSSHDLMNTVKDVP